jgi:hypothetical protein
MRRSAWRCIWNPRKLKISPVPNASRRNHPPPSRAGTLFIRGQKMARRAPPMRRMSFGETLSISGIVNPPPSPRHERKTRVIARGSRVNRESAGDRKNRLDFPAYGKIRRLNPREKLPASWFYDRFHIEQTVIKLAQTATQFGWHFDCSIWCGVAEVPHIIQSSFRVFVRAGLKRAPTGCPRSRA